MVANDWQRILFNGYRKKHERRMGEGRLKKYLKNPIFNIFYFFDNENLL